VRGHLTVGWGVDRRANGRLTRSVCGGACACASVASSGRTDSGPRKQWTVGLAGGGEDVCRDVIARRGREVVDERPPVRPVARALVVPAPL
jgi:putative intracellular protease/amidase